MSIKYRKICITNDGKYLIDFNLIDKRYRLYNGNKIKLKLNPNSFPVKHRRRQAELLAKKVYDHVVFNNYSFDKDCRSNELVLFNRLIDSNNTIYSFRHSGAIDIFKRTGSITKLQ